MMAGRKSRKSQARTLNATAPTGEAKPSRVLPELVFGLVGPVKTDLKFVGNELEELLRQVGYGDIQRIRISDLITEIEREIPLRDLDGEKITLETTPEDRRLLTYMEAGNAIRRMTGDPSILAAYAVGQLRQGRDPQKARASIIHSLKTPEETHLLRRIYGVGFFLIGASSPRLVRENSLATAIASDRGVGQSSKKFAECQEIASRLIEKDENEPESSGQKLRDTFHLSDFFVSLADESKTSRDAASAELRRFVELVMGNLAHTPTKAEYLMFQAYAASMRSGALARQVGAVVATEKGEVLGLGCNDVPRAGGGLYWPSDPDDARDLTRERDSSNELSEQMLGELLDQMRGHGLLAAVPDMADVRRALRGTRVLSLLEFGRTTHAEMEALLSAARVGVSTQDCVLYTTTFPCHECARLILTAGVKRVVYVEPYPKSLAAQLHSDGISIGTQEKPANGLPKVEFLPFAGVGPRRYMDLFSMMTSVGKSLDRKTSDGFRIRWSPETAEPRLPLLPASYIELEGKTLLEIEERFRRQKVISRDNSPREKRNGRR
jgi:deoxycytidylate deaminase